MKLVLLLALILPLQSFAWVHCGSPGTDPVAAHAHCGNPAGASHSGDVQQHHHCGSCCTAAVAATPFRLAPPALTNPRISLPADWPPLRITLDRLDRPPRPVIR